MTRRSLAVMAFAASILIVCTTAYRAGAKLNAESQIFNARAIRDENVEFCRKYTNSTASELFNDCSKDLAEIRRKHEERINDIFYSSAATGRNATGD